MNDNIYYRNSPVPGGEDKANISSWETYSLLDILELEQ